MTHDFSQRYGPWAVVTGASSGIGEAFAHALAKRGVRSLLVARRTRELERVADEVRKATGVECATLTADLADPNFIDAVEERTRDLDVGLVVSNAGYNPIGTFAERTREELCRILDVNCRAPMLLAHAFRPRLLERGRGGFLITGSVEGFFGVPYSAPYAASKNYVLALGEALWGESLDTDIDVLVLAPSTTDTAIIRARNMQNYPGIMQPGEVAEHGLVQLREGPVTVPGEANREMVAGFAAMPRTRAVVTMGEAMAAAMQGS
jgi:short-subunit dehydrogenase